MEESRKIDGETGKPNSKYPRQMRDLINGPIERAALTLGAVVGAYIGWEIGSHAVEYASSLRENLNTLDMVIKNNPLMTKVISLGIGCKVIGDLSRIAGTLADKALGTYHKSK
jgi:hypothetical protein